jgi:hypothetical protein
METSKTLAEALPEEIARVKIVLGYYKEIGAPGRIGATLIEHSLGMAERAIAEQDVVAMIRAYNDLKNISE